MAESSPETSPPTYFMAYAYRHWAVHDGPLHLGSCVVREHPIAVVERWNRNARGRTTPDTRYVVLLSWQRLTAEEVAQFPDAYDREV